LNHPEVHDETIFRPWKPFLGAKKAESQKNFLKGVPKFHNFGVFKKGFIYSFEDSSPEFS
jgi:hypothetical protein